MAGRTENPVALFKADLDRYMPTIAGVLPPNIQPEAFRAAVMTAANLNPDLATKATRTSILTSCMKAAADGLLPDGREGAIVIFGSEAQFLPMVQGVIKRMRQTGKLKSLRAHAVFEKDLFHYSYGDEERIQHEPYNGLDDPGAIIAAYAIAIMDNGEIQREVVLRRDLKAARAASKAPNSPAWVKFESEMSRKVAIHRISKYIPNSSVDAEWLATQLDDPDGRMKDITPPTVASGPVTASELTGEEPTVTVTTDAAKPEPEVTAQDGTPADPNTGEIVQGLSLEMPGTEQEQLAAINATRTVLAINALWDRIGAAWNTNDAIFEAQRTRRSLLEASERRANANKR